MKPHKLFFLQYRLCRYSNKNDASVVNMIVFTDY